METRKGKKEKDRFRPCPKCGAKHVWFCKTGNRIEFFDTYHDIKGIDFKPHVCNKTITPENAKNNSR